MSKRFLASLGALSAVIGAAGLAPVPVAGQALPAATKTAAAKIATDSALPALSGSPKLSAKAKAWTPPRTPWGDPDLQGIWPGRDMMGVPFERPAQFGARQRLTDEEVAQREEQARRQVRADREEFVAPPAARAGAATGGATAGTGPPSHWGERGKAQRQASLVVDPPDGRIPPMTPDGQKRAETLWRTSFGSGPWNAPEDLGPYDRCISRGVLGTMTPVGYNAGNQIVQAPGYVAIRQEMIHEARIIPLDGRAHVGQDIRTYMGDSRGHWEDNTLVVETTNFNGRIGATGNGNNNPMSEALRLVERFTRVDANTIQYEVTVSDPKTWTGTWKATFPLKRDPNYGMFEYACHEGNQAMKNILSGARAQEARESR